MLWCVSSTFFFLFATIVFTTRTSSKREKKNVFDEGRTNKTLAVYLLFAMF